MSSSNTPKIIHSNLQLVDATHTGRFELWRNSGDEKQFIGFIGYNVDSDARPPIYDIQHTIIAEEYSRQGYARALTTMVLEELDRRHALFISHCSYLDDYLTRYPEYQRLQAE